MKEESFTMESDPEAANILFQITILVILTLINAFFAGSEMAVVSVNKNKIHRLSEQGNKNAESGGLQPVLRTSHLSYITYHESLYKTALSVHQRLSEADRHAQ